MTDIAERRSDERLACRSATRSHVGRVRRINEDRVFAAPDRGLWAVADGMGGHSGGDIAAEMAVATLRALPPRADAGAIEAALQESSLAIRRLSAGSGQSSGSTIILLSVTGHRATVLWAGDSRAYRLRGGTIEQLSRDHSVVQEMIDAGALSADKAQSHPQSHIITRAMGGADALTLDRVDVDTVPGDVFLLCSDGLTREVSDAIICSVLREAPIEAANRLLEAALIAGGRDNISFALVAIDRIDHKDIAPI